MAIHHRRLDGVVKRVRTPWLRTDSGMVRPARVWFKTGDGVDGDVEGRPFSSSSPWNQIIPLGTSLGPNSANQITQVTSGDAFVMLNLYEYGVPIYYVSPGDSTYTIVPANFPEWGANPFAGYDVPMPAGMVPSTGTDGALVVIDITANLVYEFWQASYDSGDDEWNCSWGAVREYDGWGWGGNATGSGASRLGGIIRLSEIEAGEINHALAIVTSTAQLTTFVAPATKTDGEYAGANPIPEGSRLRLDPTLDLDAMGLSEGERAICVALQTYGAFLMDRTTSGGFGIICEVDPAATSGSDVGEVWDSIQPEWAGWDYYSLGTENGFADEIANAMQVVTVAVPTDSTPEWIEVWPLTPNAPTGLVTALVWRNDRYEIDFAWDAPVGGADVINYRLEENPPNTAEWGAVALVAAPSEVATDTSVTSSTTRNYRLRSEAANDRVSDWVTTSVIVPAPPVPDAPTMVSGTCAGGYATVGWTHPGGATLQGFNYYVSINSGFFYFAGSEAAGTSKQVSIAAPNGSTIDVRVEAYGAGGTSAYSTRHVEVPGTPTITFYRYYLGELIVQWIAGAYASTYLWQANHEYWGSTFSNPVEVAAGGSGAWKYMGTTPGLGASSGFPRDFSRCRYYVTPKNAYGTGTPTVYAYLRKIPNPIRVNPINAGTWRTNIWRPDQNGDYGIYQGATSAGLNWGCFFYGTLFQQYYSAGFIGYEFTPSAAAIYLIRATSGGNSAGIAPHIWLHQMQNRTPGVFNTNWGGGESAVTLAWNQEGWCTFPPHWATHLIRLEWAGVGVMRTELPPPNPTAAYMIIDAGGTAAAIGGTVVCGTVSIEHDA